MDRDERMMRIVMITNNFPPQVDGVGDYSHCLSRELSGRGHELHVICNRRVQIDGTVEGIKVYPIIPKWTKRNYELALKQIMDIRPDWVIIQYVPYAFHHFGMPVAIVRFMRRIKQNGFPIFVFFHEFFIGLQFKSLKNTLVALTQMWITRRMCKHAAIAATSTDHYINVLQQWRKDIHQIPIGSNIPAPGLAQATASAEPVFTIITFGLRDVEVLLRFFSIIQKEIKNIELVVCGKQYRETSPADTGKVHFTGYLPAKEVAQWLGRADVFLLPDFVSRQGDGGTCLKSGSLAAAFAAGLPIIGMKGKMNDRLLQALDSVQLVDYYDYESWKSAVLKVYRRQNAQTDQRSTIRRFYERHLAWKSIGDRYLQLINSTG